MGRNKGGGGRSYNAPVKYEPSITVHGTNQMAVSTIDDSSSNLSVNTTSSLGIGMGGIPQIIERENIELWLAVLRDFLVQLEQHETVFCQIHRLSAEVVAQLRPTIIGLLMTNRGQLNVSELSAIYQTVQQILLNTQASTGEVE